MIFDGISMKGRLHVVVQNEQDGSTREYNFENLVVTVGKNYVASRMVGATPVVMSHMQLGTGTNAAVAGDTVLQTPLTPRSTLTGSASTNIVTYTATFPAGQNTGAITEAGIFNDATAGTMLARTVFPVVNKAATDSITITWTVTVA